PDYREPPEANDDAENADDRAGIADHEANAPLAAASGTPYSEAPAGTGSGPALGKTMLGYAAPTPRPRGGTPWPPPSTVAEPPSDDVAGMMLEGFRPVPAAGTSPQGPGNAGPAVLSSWRESSGPHPEPAPPGTEGSIAPPPGLLPTIPPSAFAQSEHG